MEIKYTVPDITPQTLDFYAFTNASLIEGEIRAIVLDFHGLGARDFRKEPNELEALLAKNNILSIFPYYGPWSWMNQRAVAFVDKIVGCACERHGLDIRSINIISSGGSMGGHSALIYSQYARYTPSACVTNCPVCDFAFHATEREDLPRTVYLAFCDEGMPLEDAITLHSAYHLAKTMPDIPYVIVHGSRDSAVNKEMHSDRFVQKMREHGKNVTYIEVDGMEHCDLGSFPEIKKQYFDTIIRLALQK